MFVGAAKGQTHEWGHPCTQCHGAAGQTQPGGGTELKIIVQ